MLENRKHLICNEPELIRLNEIKLAGMVFYYETDDSIDLKKPWDYLIKNQEMGSIFFFIGLEVNKLTTLPIQYTGKTVGAGKYLKFYHREYSRDVCHTYEYIYNFYLPDTDHKLPFHYNFETYGKEFKGAYNPESISEIYIPNGMIALMCLHILYDIMKDKKMSDKLCRTFFKLWLIK